MTDVPSLARPEEFAGRVALVTGGTDGLGRHLVKTLIELGAEVFFCGRRRELGEALADELGERAHFVRCDLADAEQTRCFVKQAGEFRGRLDYLVNNAAIDPVTPLAETTVERFDQIVAINLRSQFVVSQTAAPYLERGEGKAVVNIGTTNYMFGFAGHTAYNAAKSGIIGLSRSLARDLGPRGIRVNVVSPGWIMTSRQLSEKVDRAVKDDLIASQCVKELMVEPHVTPVTLFLLSSAARGICGQNIVVDGGKYMQ